MKPLTPGTLDLLVLRTLGTRSLHGYGIAVRLKELSDEVLLVEEGTLYPALHRMERRGLLRSEWGKTDTGRRARFYSATDEGSAHLKSERKAWQDQARLVGRMLGVELA
ncbi:MAG: PadR family transcriptional regulator [Planctomycetota bacterium]